MQSRSLTQTHTHTKKGIESQGKQHAVTVNLLKNGETQINKRENQRDFEHAHTSTY